MNKDLKRRMTTVFNKIVKNYKNDLNIDFEAIDNRDKYFYKSNAAIWVLRENGSHIYFIPCEQIEQQWKQEPYLFGSKSRRDILKSELESLEHLERCFGKGNNKYFKIDLVKNTVSNSSRNGCLFMYERGLNKAISGRIYTV